MYSDRICEKLAARKRRELRPETPRWPVLRLHFRVIAAATPPP